MKDARSKKQIALYLEQMQEIKHRIAYIKSNLAEGIERIEIESLVLQIRKIIELIAFSQISIHMSNYRNRRSLVGESYERDWNARSIFNHVKSLGQDSYPIPLDPEFKIMPDGSKHFSQLEKSSFLSEKQLLKLYERCGGLLHADNPWKPTGNKYNNFVKELPRKLEQIKGLLNYHAVLVNHWEEKVTTTLLIAMNSLNELPIYHVGHGDGNSYLSR